MNNGYQILNEPDDQAPDDDLSFDEKEKCNKKVKKEKKRIFAMKCPIRAQKSLSRVKSERVILYHPFPIIVAAPWTSKYRPSPYCTTQNTTYRQQGWLTDSLRLFLLSLPLLFLSLYQSSFLKKGQTTSFFSFLKSHISPLISHPIWFIFVTINRFFLFFFFLSHFPLRSSVDFYFSQACSFWQKNVVPAVRSVPQFPPLLPQVTVSNPHSLWRISC